MPKKVQTEKQIKRSMEAIGFYSDSSREGTLYAVLVRSPAATGKIKGVTIPELPEGYFLFTADDIPGEKFPPPDIVLFCIFMKICKLK